MVKFFKNFWPFGLALLLLTGAWWPFPMPALAEPAASKGVLDLTGWDLAEKGALRLDGEWTFFWNRFCAPDRPDPRCQLSRASHIRVPGVWNGRHENGKDLEGEGFATYRLVIKTGPNQGDLAIQFPVTATAFKAFADGRLIYQSGLPGPSAQESVPFYKPGWGAIRAAPNARVVLIIWVSNHDHWQGGLWKSLRLGARPQIEKSLHWDLMSTLMLFGAIVMMGVFYLFAGLFRKKLTYPRWFGLFCLLAAVRLLTTGAVPVVALLEGVAWPVLQASVYISLYLMIPCFLCFLRGFFPGEVGKTPLVASWLVSLLFVASVFLFTPRWYSLAMPVFQTLILMGLAFVTHCLGQAVRKKRAGALAVAAGFVVLFLAAMNDILFSRHFIDTSYITPWGVFFFLLAISLAIAARVGEAYKTIEDQGAALTLSHGKLERELNLRKATEQALARERDYLEVITRSIGAGLAIISRDYNTIWANKVIENIFGDVVGKNCHRAYNRRERICPGCGVKRVFETGEDLVVSEQKGVDLDGEEVWSELIVTPIRENGEVVAALELVIPVTQRKQAELEREKLAAQLRQAQKMEAVGVLAGGVAHDFNNLLHIIKGSAQMALVNQDQAGRVEEALEQINLAAGRAAQLVSQLLTFSRKVEPHLSHLDLNREVAMAAGLLQRTLPKMIKIELDLAEGLPPVKGNPSQLEQIILNLGSNARDAMPEGGRLTFRTRPGALDDQAGQRPAVVMLVEDTGCGMEPETLEHVFEPFFTTKEPGKGTGLGLSAVYGVVKAHGGKVTCRSQPGQGATLEITLPAAPGEAGAPQTGTARQHKVCTGSERVMVVDDEEAIAEMAAEVLELHGYRTRLAVSGEQALAAYKQEPVDLVVMDLGMPGMGGLSALQKILELDPAAKVLVASGYAGAEDEATLLQKGAVGFLRKPFDLTQLAAEVRRVLDCGGGQP